MSKKDKRIKELEQRVKDLEDALFHALKDVLWKGAKEEPEPRDGVLTTYVNHVETNDIVRAEKLLEKRKDELLSE